MVFSLEFGLESCFVELVGLIVILEMSKNNGKKYFQYLKNSTLDNFKEPLCKNKSSLN